MKYKYHKGSEADFFGAPEWAVYYVEVHHEDGKVVRAWEGDNYRYCYTPNSDGCAQPMEEFNGLSGVIHYDWFNAEVIIVAHREPIPEEKASVTIINNPTDQLITERGNRYGKFKDGAEIMQSLKDTMRDVDGWNNLTASQKEALDMIQHKIGRILNGDPTYDDSWKDIAGYATLIVNELNEGVK